MSTIYISIRQLKQLLLIVACVFLASFNYLTYAETTTANSVTCDKTLDSDCDGLINTEEKLYGTNPDLADTDGDGYSDGVEVKSGYDPLKAAPGDKLDTVATASTTSDQTSVSTTSSAPSLTDQYLQNLATYASSKNGQSVSTTDISTFIEEQTTKNMGDPITWDSLPAIDQSQIKILKQDYSALSDTDRKKKESEDAVKYLNQMIYIIANNLPDQILTPDDFTTFQNTFFSHLSDVFTNDSVSNSTNYEYFSDLGNRLEIFINQANDVQVPETMIGLHVKFFRLAKGILSLRDSSFDSNDAVGKMISIKKVSTYIQMFSDFVQKDCLPYFKQISTN